MCRNNGEGDQKTSDVKREMGNIEVGSNYRKEEILLQSKERRGCHINKMTGKIMRIHTIYYLP